MIAYNASDFVVRVSRIRRLELALGGGTLVATRLSMVTRALAWKLTCGAPVLDEGPGMACPGSREDAFGTLQGEG